MSPRVGRSSSRIAFAAGFPSPQLRLDALPEVRRRAGPRRRSTGRATASASHFSAQVARGEFAIMLGAFCGMPGQHMRSMKPRLVPQRIQRTDGNRPFAGEAHHVAVCAFEGSLKCRARPMLHHDSIREWLQAGDPVHQSALYKPVIAIHEPGKDWASLRPLRFPLRLALDRRRACRA